LKKEDMLTLQEISKDINVSYQTLNYYTTLGLLHPFKRSGNKRLYDAKMVKKRLTAINRLKNEGYPLKIIANVLNKHRSDLF